MNQLFCDKDGQPSSKRVIACAIFMVVLICYIHDDIISKEMPTITEFLIGSAVTLLGIDPVTNVFNNKIKNEITSESVESNDAEHREESQGE